MRINPIILKITLILTLFCHNAKSNPLLWGNSNTSNLLQKFISNKGNILSNNENLVKNPTALRNLNDIAIGSGTPVVTRVTTTPLNGVAHFEIANNVSTTSTFFGINNTNDSFLNKKCEVIFDYSKTVDGSNVYLRLDGNRQNAIVLSNTGGNVYQTNQQIDCPDKNAVLDLEFQLVANSGIVKITNIFFGKAKNQFQFASNSNVTATTSDTTSFTSSENGSQFPAAALGTTVSRDVKFTKKFTNSDQFILEYMSSNSFTGWKPLSQKFPLIKQGTCVYGMEIDSISSDTSRVYFHTCGASPTGTTYATNGESWTVYASNSAFRWRVRLQNQ